MPVTRGAVWLAEVIDECRFGTSLFRLYRRDCGADQESIELRSAYEGRLIHPGPSTVNAHVKQWSRPDRRGLPIHARNARGAPEHAWHEVARADRGSFPMRRVGAMSASENLERPE